MFRRTRRDRVFAVVRQHRLEQVLDLLVVDAAVAGNTSRLFLALPCHVDIAIDEFRWGVAIPGVQGRQGQVGLQVHPWVRTPLEVTSRRVV
jgi:hypothetical protein